MKAPYCLVCDKVVEVVWWERLETELAYRFRIECHGQTAVLYQTHQDAYQGDATSLS